MNRIRTAHLSGQGARDRSRLPDVKSWGVQKQFQFEIGDAKARSLLSLERADHRWAIAVHGNVTCSLVWGTGPNIRLEGIDAPLIGTFPGSLVVEVLNRDLAAATSGTCSAAPVTSCCEPFIRQFIPTVAGATPLNPLATAFTALAASTVTIRGQAVALTVTQRIPLVTGSVLTAGTGFAEFAA